MNSNETILFYIQHDLFQLDIQHSAYAIQTEDVFQLGELKGQGTRTYNYKYRY